MAIGTLAELKTAIGQWMINQPEPAVIDNCVALCEANIRRDVRCRAMEASAAGALTSTKLPLPTRFVEVRQALLNDYPQRYVMPEEFQTRRNHSSGLYTVVGEEFVFQSATADYRIDYYQAFATLAANGDTNWLLANHPDVYLFGSLAEVAAYQRDDPALWIGRYQAAVNRLTQNERKAIAPLVMRPEIVE